MQRANDLCVNRAAFQTYASVQSSLLRNLVWHWLMVLYRRFGTTYLPFLEDETHTSFRDVGKQVLTNAV
jgi:hypothetical protein